MRSCARRCSCRPPTASTSAGCCRRACTTPPPALRCWREYGEPASYIIPSGNLGNALACLWARQAGPADRRHRAGAQRQPHRAGLSRTGGEWQPRASIADAGLGDGRGQPQQHGAPAARCFRRCRRPARGRERVHGRAMTQIRARIRAGLRANSGRSGARTRPSRPRRTQRLPPEQRAQRPLGAGRDRASGEVPRDRRAADRARGAGAGEPGARCSRGRGRVSEIDAEP